MLCYLINNCNIDHFVGLLIIESIDFEFSSVEQPNFKKKYSHVAVLNTIKGKKCPQYLLKKHYFVITCRIGKYQ